jgi:hypothetical protein
VLLSLFQEIQEGERRGGKGEQQFPGNHRLPGENLFERKLNRRNRMLEKKEISC